MSWIGTPFVVSYSATSESSPVARMTPGLASLIPGPVVIPGARARSGSAMKAVPDTLSSVPR